MCAEQGELARSLLVIVRADLDASMEKHKGEAQKIIDLDEAFCIAREKECQFKEDVQVKSTLLVTATKEVDEKSKDLVDFEVVPTLWPNDVKELGRHEQIMLEM